MEGGCPFEPRQGKDVALFLEPLERDGTLLDFQGKKCKLVDLCCFILLSLR